MNRKTVKRLFLSLVCLIPFAVHSATAEVDGITWTYTVTANGEASLGGGTTSTPAVPTTTAGALTIPTEIDGHTITAIGDHAFRGCSNLTAVTISDTITSIGASAFRNCTKLVSLQIPMSVHAIEGNTFEGCTSLTSMELPQNVTSIGGAAFYACTSLISVTLPESVTYIGGGVFSGCTSLRMLTIPSAVSVIREHTFYQCSNLTSVTIPNSITTIEEYAFSGCSSLKSLTISASLTSIASSAFSGCSALPLDEQGIRYESEERKGIISVPTSFAGALSIPDSVSFIFPNAFNGCTGVTSIAFPESITFLGNPALSSCSSLPTDEYGVRYESDVRRKLLSAPSSLTGAFTIPTSVHMIFPRAFENCQKLTSVTIPEGVTTIGENAFSGCSALTTFSLPASVETMPETALPPSSDNLVSLDVALGNPLYYSENNILYNKGKTEILRVARGGIAGALTLPSTLTSIPNNAFQNCSSLSFITIPIGVTSIGDYAFSACTKLTAIDLPSSVITIGGHAFERCSSLTSWDLPEGIETIGEYAFSYNSSLRSFKLPASVTSMPFNAFTWPDTLEKLEVASGNPLYYTESNILYNKEKTEILRIVKKGISGNIVLPSSITSIPNSTFSGCLSLTSVTIPEGVTSIGGGAFNNCSALTAFSLPASVETMPENALPPSSNNLKALEVAPDNPLYCTENNILYNKSKTKILCVARGGIAGVLTLPSTLTSIPNGAFYDSLVTSVIIPEGVTSIGNDAFSGCSSLTSVTISASVTSIGDGAFWNCSSLTSVVIPDGVTSIGNDAFSGCSSLTSVTIPSSVTSIEGWAFYGCTALKDVTFLGDVPQGFSDSFLNGKHIDFPKEYGTNWTAALSNRGTYAEIVNRAGVTATAEMPTPKTMKVTYSVKSEKKTVKVRAVAFKDGVRSFANVVPVKSGENVPNGAEVTANEEHTFVWNISEDWDIDLAKVAVEILVEEGTLLPQELITIPGAPMNRADMTITRNTLSEAQAFDALLWCYAEEIASGASTLTLSSGVVKIGTKVVVAGNKVATDEYRIGWVKPGETNTTYTYSASATTLLNYLYGKMGYQVLSGEDYTYAKAATRLELAKEGLGQVSVKIAETAKE